MTNDDLANLVTGALTLAIGACVVAVLSGMAVVVWRTVLQ